MLLTAVCCDMFANTDAIQNNEKILPTLAPFYPSISRTVGAQYTFQSAQHCAEPFLVCCNYSRAANSFWHQRGRRDVPTYSLGKWYRSRVGCAQKQPLLLDFSADSAGWSGDGAFLIRLVFSVDDGVEMRGCILRFVFHDSYPYGRFA